MMNCHSNIDKPNHYQLESGKEVIEIIKDTLGEKGCKDFCKGNIIKYITRCEKKNGVEDLEKAKKYIDFIIELEKRKEKENEK